MIESVAASLGYIAPIICAPAMIRDPIVEEVRKARAEYAKRFNFDLNAMFDDLPRRQRESGRQTVSLPPKRRAAATKASGGDG